MPLLMAGDSLARNGGLLNPIYFPAQPMSRAVPLSEPSFSNIVSCNEWKRSTPFALLPSAYPIWQNMLPIIRLQQLSLGTKYPNTEKKSLDMIYPNLASFTTYNPSPPIPKYHNGHNNNPGQSFFLPTQQSNARLFDKHSIEKHVDHQINQLILRPDLGKPNTVSPAWMMGKLDKVLLQGQGKCNLSSYNNDHSGTLHEIGDLQLRKRSSSWPVDKALKKKFLRKSENSPTHSYKNLEMDVANILVSDIPIPVVGFNSKENRTESQQSVKLDSCARPHSSDSSVDSDNSSQSDRENLCNNKSKTGTVAFTCQQCAVTCETMNDLISHEAKHTTNNFTFSCNVCTQVFRSTNGLQKHVEFHADDEHRYNCSFCLKPFGNKEGLEEHIINMHTSKRPHKCTYCPKAFRDPGSLQKHVRVHTGEKPYKCNACEKSFAEYSSLRKHLRVHTGEQPYKCRFCPKAFSISGNLQRHILIHTGERPYKCSNCTKAFNNPSHLRRHIKNLHSKLENQK